MRIKHYIMAATPVRRPVVFATFVFLFMGHLLPSGTAWQMVRIFDNDGKPQSEFALRADDPRLSKIIAYVEKAKSTPPQLTSQYVTSKWDIELAEIYARDQRFALTNESTAEANQAAVNQPSIKQASYTAKASDTSNSPASMAGSSAQDWTAYWMSMRSSASDKIEQLNSNAKESNIFQRTEISELLPGKRATFFFAVQLLFTALTFLCVSRWLAPTSLPRLPLSTRIAVQVPKEWIGRAGYGMFSVKRWNRFQIAEVLVILACCAFIL